MKEYTQEEKDQKCTVSLNRVLKGSCCKKVFFTSISPFIFAFCRVVIGLTFGISSITKLRDISAFKLSIHQMRILPVWAEVPAAWCGILAELAVPVLLLFGQFLFIPGFMIAAGLLLLFSGVLGATLARRFSTSCNCFGQKDRQISFIDLVRNAGLLLFAVLGGGIAIWLPPDLETVGIMEWLFITLAAGVLTIALIQIKDIIQLFA